MASDNQMAVCTTAQWTFNSRNQSPCVVGSALAGVCVGGDFTLTALEPDFVYLGPSATSATSCRCSSVYYSMLSACALCQDRNFVRFSRYSANCSTVYVGVFPQPIPASISVPAWAYLDVEDGDTFNVTLAQAATGPESVAVPSATGSTTRPTGSSGSSGTTGTQTGVQGPSETGTVAKKSNAGAIAGGVVGGIVGLALIGLAIFFFLRRRKAKKTPPSAMYSGVSINAPSSPAPMSYGDGSSGVYPSIPSPKPYNPQDPSTFPQYNAPYTPPPGQQYTGGGYPQSGYVPSNVTGQSGTTHANTLVNAPATPARYTGAPEL